MHARLSVATTLLLLLPGCALFFGDATRPSKFTAAFPWSREQSATSDDSNAAILPVARLEATIVTRPATDLRISRLIWEELDESGLMAPEVRQRLNQNGFRVGVAGSATPWVLQSLARDAASVDRLPEQQQPASTDGTMPLGPAFDLMPNGKSLLEIQSGLDHSLTSFDGIPALADVRDRSQMKCILEVVAKDISDEGVQLSILPQIHTGAATPRLSISGQSEQLPVRQHIVPLYDQQFEIRLHPGEVAVIGRQDSESASGTGRLFFQPQSGSAAEERVLMIRFTGVEKLRGQRDPSFRLTAWGE